MSGGALEVAVVSRGIAHVQKISVARDLGTGVEAAGGVGAGDQVILNPPVGLADGAFPIGRAAGAFSAASRWGNG